MKQLPDTLIVEVTQRDIDAGLRGNCTFCPIARAAKRAVRKLGFPNYWTSIGRDLDVNQRRSGETVVRYTGTPEATEFVSAFDSGLPVAPLTLTFSLGYRA